MLLALVRHGPTAWNAAGRIQGRTDTSLSDSGRAAVRGWRLPADFAPVRVLSSPLLRATETAEILFGQAPAIEPRLIEMDWSAWEGRTLEKLRRDHGAAMATNEARGLDFTPPGGESPREVQARLRPWLAEIGAGAGPAAAVTHKGVIRALFSLALDWDMTARAPVEPESACLHLFEADAGGGLVARTLNLPLEERAAPPA
ncbi:MAG TPA: histidine phosphatase family protein [Alphaproteobacteria bacterium]|jgi:probable phosphoglycerate mutase|nr:histidine phosphatase family protein [Alphaproteobacteria bacterium]